MKEPKRKFVDKTDGERDWFEPFNSASTMDCTGLIPAAPISHDEHEAYKEIYDFDPSVSEVEEDL